MKPVGRRGTTNRPRIKATSGDFDSRLRWADGVEMQVATRQGKTDGVGPGSVVGAPQTTFELTLTNNRSTELDVSSVVLTTTYAAKPKRLAPPVYDESVRDFGGSVKPGATATAVYSFSIPTNQLADVTLTIDLDANHAPASFAGSLR